MKKALIIFLGLLILFHPMILYELFGVSFNWLINAIWVYLSIFMGIIIFTLGVVYFIKDIKTKEAI